MEENQVIKILVVDDSFFMRRLIADILESESDIFLAGMAGNGVEAIKMAKKLRPNVILMDYMMPEMNGEQAASAIVSEIIPAPAIIMLSAWTDQGAEETMKCLKAGAVDFLAKPSGEISLDLEMIKVELVQKIRVAAQARVKKPIAGRRLIEPRKSRIAVGRPGIAVIGASTGGPPVVEYILTNLPANLGVPIFVVQHMPEKFTRFFAERLNKVAVIEVGEAQDGVEPVPGRCYVAPGGWHSELEMRHGQPAVHLTKAPAYYGLRPAINRTMSSAAKVFFGNTVAIILTGMGDDGTEGVRDVQMNGGYAIAQSPDTAVIGSMPKSIIEKGLANEILAPEKIVERIIELCS